MSLSEQLHIDDRLDKYKSWNSAQQQKEKAEFMRQYFKLSEKFSNKQILSKEKQLRNAYRNEVNQKEEELGLVMGNIAEGMLQQAFYGGDQSSAGSSQQQMTTVLKAVNDKEKRNTKEIEAFLEEAKASAVKQVFNN